MTTLADPPPPRRVWFAILGGPAAWAVQLTASWLVIDFACIESAPPSQAAPLARVLDIGISIAMLAVAIAAFAFGVQAWRRSSNTSPTATHSFTRPEFMAAVALFVSAAFLVGVLWASLGSLLLPACERSR